MYRIVYLILCSYLMFACTEKKQQLPYYNEPNFTPIFLQNESDVNKQITHTIADFSFTDQEKKTITQKNIEGKIHVANFFFTSCGSICPVMTNHMKLVDKAFKNDTNVILLSFSVAPWVDSVQKLNVYSQANEIDAKNWHLLTGKKDSIYTLARKSYFAEEDLGFTKDSKDFLHTEHFLLVDQNKRIRGIYNGTLRLDIEQLIKDIQELKKEEK
mgnify:CR=1 FL=1|jgi:protein SCO1/2